MPKGKRGPRKKQFRELLQYQVKYSVDKRVFKTREKAQDATERALRHFLKTGDTINGVKITARWRNPNNKNPKHANWKTTDDVGQSLHDFWQTLHKARGALRALAARSRL